MLKTLDLRQALERLGHMEFYEVTLTVYERKNLLWFETPDGIRHKLHTPSGGAIFGEYSVLPIWPRLIKEYTYFYGRAGPNNTFFAKPTRLTEGDKRETFLNSIRVAQTKHLPEVQGYIAGEIENPETSSEKFSWWEPVTKQERLFIQLLQGVVTVSAGKLVSKLTQYHPDGSEDTILVSLAQDAGLYQPHK